MPKIKKLSKVHIGRRGLLHPSNVMLVVVTFAFIGSVTLTASNALGTYCVNKTYVQTGNKRNSQCVGYIKAMLNYDCLIYRIKGCHGLTVTNQYDIETTAQVKLFQRHFQLTQDGVVGPQTWKTFCRVTNNNYLRWQAGCPGYR